jgi:predicted DNA-binding protein (MmcQ/YjbR family)
MTWDELLEYCLAKPGAWQDEPWGDGVVTKVGQKIFAFLGTADAAHRGVGLKCGASREAADEWLIRYPDDASVMPYIGRSGWNNLRAGDAIPDDEIFEAIDASYAMVVSKLPKKDRPASLADVTLRPPRPARSARLARPAPPGPAGWRGRRGQPTLRR